MRTPYLWVALFSVLATIAAFWAAHEQQRETRELLGQVTGGESLVYLEPLRKGGRVTYFVRHTGSHPAYDVVVRIQEVISRHGRRVRQDVFGPSEVGRTLLRGSGFDWTYPDPTPSDEREWPLIFPEPPRPDAAPRVFRIELAARNGIIIQRVRVYPVADRWHTTSNQVERAGVGALVLPTDFSEAQTQPPNPPEREEE